MKVVFATYVDKQDLIEYPLWYLKKKDPNLIIYCSDDYNKQHLAKSNIEAEIINYHINEPSDIATAQNICLEKLYAEHHADFVVWQQADMHITEYGRKLILDYCLTASSTQVTAVAVRHIRLFMVAWSSYFGVTILGKDSTKRFIFDGAYCDGWSHLGAFDPTELNALPVIDIGYLSVDQYKRHRTQNAKTWRENEYVNHLSDKEYLEFVLKKDAIMIGNNTILPRNGLLYSVVEELGLVAEYNQIYALIEAKQTST
jgi:hypothetical protein